MKRPRANSWYRLMAIWLFSAPIVLAQDYKNTPAAPIPAEIASSKVVFIANGGGEDSSDFAGGPERAYDDFYAAMKNWGHYKLESYPENSGLSLEISFVAAPYDREVFEGRTNDSQAYDPQIRLVVRGSKSQALLWVFREHVEWARMQSNRDKNFDVAMGKIVDSLKKLVSGPLGSSAASK